MLKAALNRAFYLTGCHPTRPGARPKPIKRVERKFIWPDKNYPFGKRRAARY
jgi:hypothetical protein